MRKRKPRLVVLQDGPLHGCERYATNKDEIFFYTGHPHSSKIDLTIFQKCLYRRSTRRGIYKFVEVLAEGIEIAKEGLAARLSR